MKPTENEIKIAKEIVDELIENDFFYAIICEDNDNLWQWRMDNKAFLEERGLSVHCGETKACIVSKKLSNWVIKTSFVYYDEYGHATADFCAIEESNYRDAVEEGLEEFFAASYKLCTLEPPRTSEYCPKENITFYIQEKAEPDEEKTSTTCSDYMSLNRDEDEDEDGCYEYDDYDRLESLFEGSKKLSDLFDFIHDWNINDLHSGNFGYTSDGKVKIIDYSGY